MSVVSRGSLDRAVADLNDKAQEMGMDRRYEFVRGSRANGIQHKLLEHQSSLQHPISETKIGASLAEALRYMEAMNHALLSVLGDRSWRAKQVTSQHAIPMYSELPEDVELRTPAEDMTVTPTHRTFSIGGLGAPGLSGSGSGDPSAC